MSAASDPDATRPEGDDPSFEQAMDRLETILERVESGEAGLEQSIAECEKGARLIARCREILAASETKIAELNLDELAAAPPQAQGADEDGAYEADEEGADA